MPVSYDSNKLIPAPFVTVQRETLARDDGKVFGHTFIITLKGKLVAYKGSPNSSGAFHTSSGYPADEIIAADSRLTAMLRKQEAILKLFREDGKSLEVQGYDGQMPMKCNPRVKRVEFMEGNWFETCDYVITLEADCVEGLVNAGICEDAPRVSKVNEEWNIEIMDEVKQTYRLTHALSATGKRMFDNTGELLDGKEAWEHARDYVLNNEAADGQGLGLGLVAARMEAPDVLNATALQAFNYIRSQNINETAGIFSVTETWVCYDPGGEPPAINEYNVQMRYSAQDNRTTVSVEGTITGLEVRDNNTYAVISTKWDNAQNKWNAYVLPNIFSAAQIALGANTPLNPVPVAKQVGLNPVAGTITYRYEYDNRPTPMTPGAITETITVNNNHAADVFAQVPVLGRPWGPVLQNIGTVTAKKRNIQIEIQMPPSTQDFVASAPNTAGIILMLMPVSNRGVFLESDEESWTPNTGRYSRNTTFVWE